MSIASTVFNRVTVPAWSSVSWPISSMTACLTGKVMEHLPAGSRVLDVGGGTGITASLLANRYGFEVDVIDASPAMLEQARTAQGVRLFYGDARNLEGSGEYDGVVFNHVLRYIPAADAEKVLVGAAESLKPGGILVISDLSLPRLRPRRVELVGSLDARLLGVWSRFSKGEFIEFVEERGLRHIRTSFPPFSFMLVFQRE